MKLNLNNLENDKLKIGNVKVIKKNGKYILMSGINKESEFYINTYENVFDYARFFCEFSKEINNSNICIMGFGIGGIPLCLSKEKSIKRIDCIDLDKRMFILFNTIIKTPAKKLHYYHYNAINFLKETNKKYDIIIDDIFSNKGKII